MRLFFLFFVTKIKAINNGIYAREVNLKIFRPVTPTPLKIGCKITNVIKEKRNTKNFDSKICFNENLNFLKRIK